jgi:hypothetical protein
MKPRCFRFTAPALALALAAALSGCGNNTSPLQPSNLSQTSADDIAVQVGAGLGANSGGAMLELGATAASVPGAPSLAPPEMVMRVSVAAPDTTFSVGGLTVILTRTFFNAQDQALPDYGPDAVRLVATSRIFGSISTPRYEASIGHAGSLDVRGIAPSADTLTFNGFAYDTVQSQFHALADTARTRYLYWNSALTHADVKLLKDRVANPWPLSGTTTWAIVADRLRSNNRMDVEAHLNATVVVVYNGTQYPEITVNGTFRYRVNLLTGEVVRV